MPKKKNTKPSREAVKGMVRDALDKTLPKGKKQRKNK